jgi:hypothetical protein
MAEKMSPYQALGHCRGTMQAAVTILRRNLKEGNTSLVETLERVLVETLERILEETGEENVNYNYHLSLDEVNEALASRKAPE